MDKKKFLKTGKARNMLWNDPRHAVTYDANCEVAKAMACKNVLPKINVDALFFNHEEIDIMIWNSAVVFAPPKTYLFPLPPPKPGQVEVNLSNHIRDSFKSQYGIDVFTQLSGVYPLVDKTRVEIVNSYVQPRIVTGNVGNLEVEFINDGEVQASVESGTAFEITHPMTYPFIFINDNGMIRGGGGHGGTGGKGKAGTKGRDGAAGIPGALGTAGKKGANGANDTIGSKTSKTQYQFGCGSGSSFAQHCDGKWTTVVWNGKWKNIRYQGTAEVDVPGMGRFKRVGGKVCTACCQTWADWYRIAKITNTTITRYGGAGGAGGKAGAAGKGGSSGKGGAGGVGGNGGDGGKGYIYKYHVHNEGKVGSPGGIGKAGSSGGAGTAGGPGGKGSPGGDSRPTGGNRGKSGTNGTSGTPGNAGHPGSSGTNGHFGGKGGLGGTWGQPGKIGTEGAGGGSAPSTTVGAAGIGFKKTVGGTDQLHVDSRLGIAEGRVQGSVV